MAGLRRPSPEDRALLGNGERQGERGFPLGRARGPAATEKRGEGDPIPVGILSPLPVAQLSDKSRVNSSSYRNEALASHGGSQVLNVAPQTERNPGHSGAMAGGQGSNGSCER